MKILKSTLLIISIMFVCSCSTQSLSVDNPAPSITNTKHSTSISLDMALCYLESFLDSGVYPETKGGDSFSYDVEKINLVKSNSFATTKSESAILPDSLFYVVPFDGGGYAILSADSRYPDPVICVCEDGNCDETDFVKAFEMLNYESPVSLVSDNEESFSFELVLASFINSINDDVITKSNGVDPGPGEIGGGGPSGITKYGPLTKSKWSQTKAGYISVFNHFTPNNAKAGCTVIATAQIMMANNFPPTISFGDTTCTMTSMLKVAPYTNPYYPGPDSCKVQAGAFAKGLGKSNNINVGYGSNVYEATSGNANGVKRTLENYGYVNVTKRIGFGSSNRSIASDEIVRGRPVYLDALEQNQIDHGHAFVLDGDLCLPQGQFFHINFGWNGIHDGYYAKGTFNTTQRHSTDAVIDSMIPPSNEDHNYTWDFRMITYELPNQ